MLALLAIQASAGDLTSKHLLRPSFAEGSLSGLDVPDISREPTLRLGSALLYEELPVSQPEPGVALLFDDRTALIVGGTASAKRLSLSLGASADVRWGLDLAHLSPERLSSGMLYASARMVAIRTEHSRLGLRASLAATTFASALLEARSELGFGLLASHQLGLVLLATDIGPRGYTGDDAEGSPPWLDWRTAARLALPEASRLAPTAQLLAKVPFVAPLEPTSRAPYALVGVEIYPSRAMTIVLEGGGAIPSRPNASRWLASSQIVWHRARADPRRPLSDGVHTFSYEIPHPPYVLPPPPPFVFDPHDHLSGVEGCATLIEIARAIESDELFGETGALSLHAQDTLEVIAEEARAHAYGTVWVSDETAPPERCSEATVRAALLLSFLLDLGVDPVRARYVDGCAEPRAREIFDSSLEIVLRIVEPGPE